MNNTTFISNAPLFVNWNYTIKCNFNCKHCYSRNDKSPELSTLDYMKISDQLIKLKVLQVNLGGGEPMLRDDYLKIIKQMSSNGVKVNLSSNGWFINEKIADDFIDVGINCVYLSLDHIQSKIHDNIRMQEGSYNKVLNSIDILNSRNIKTKLSIVITKVNFNVLDKLVELTEKKSIDGIDFKRFRPQGNGLMNRGKFELTKQQEVKLFSKIKDWKAKRDLNISLVYNEKPIKGIDEGCPCGKRSIAIRPNGDIRPCVYSNLTVGNMLKDNLLELWINSTLLKQLRNSENCIGLHK